MSGQQPQVPEEFAAIEADWRPAPYEAGEIATLPQAVALSGLFDQAPVAAGVGDALPPLWHWLYLLDRPAQAGLGADGHVRDGDFVPPLADRHRMFGGGRLTFHDSLRIGDIVTRRSELAKVRVRRGSMGWLLVVTVRHELTANGELCVTEEQDLLYRRPDDESAAAAPAAGFVAEPADGPAPPWSFGLTPDPTLLFRFSALTYNAHRIHYDRDYVRDVEGHPDLVVHGPLLALALLELPRRFAPGRTVDTYTYRCNHTLFAPEPIRISGGPEGSGDGSGGPDSARGREGRALLAAGRPGAPGAVTGSVTFR